MNNFNIHLQKVRDVKLTAQDLIDFESRVVQAYNEGKIKAPIHLSKGNEEQLIEIFQYVHPDDWVFSSWRNHYHALLHGVDPEYLYNWILEGRSMCTNSVNPKFYSSSIVGGIIPIALGAAKALKMKRSFMLDGKQPQRAWCFIGDMTFESGIFYEAYKYANNFNLPLQFVVEDNNMSTNTPTDVTWKGKRDVPFDVIHYSYERGYPHHGSGTYVMF